MSSENYAHPADKRATMVENKPKSISVTKDGKSTSSDIMDIPRGRKGRNHNRRSNNNQRTKNRGGRRGNHHSNKPKKSRFEGACSELKGRVLNVGASQTLLYQYPHGYIEAYWEALHPMSYHDIVKPTKASATFTRVQ